MFIQNVNKDDIIGPGKLIYYLSLEFCNIFQKKSKFNWGIHLFKVSVISYCLKWLSWNRIVSWPLAVYAYGNAL